MPRSQPPSPTSVAGRRSPESSDSRLRAVAVAVGLMVAGFVASTALGAAAFVVLLLAGGGTDLGAAEFAVLLVAGQLGLGLVGAAYVARWQPVAARIRLPTVRGLAVVLGAVVAPIEELLFRGPIQGRLRRAFGPTGAIVGASARFASVHVLNFTGPVGGGLAFAAGIGVVPLLWGYLYERTRNRFVPIHVHGLYNATLFGITALTLA